MKGQAFIGLPNEKAAAKALKEANGYVLFEKPMVVVSFSSSIYITFFMSCLSVSSFAFVEGSAFVRNVWEEERC